MAAVRVAGLDDRITDGRGVDPSEDVVVRENVDVGPAGDPDAERSRRNAAEAARDADWHRSREPIRRRTRPDDAGRHGVDLDPVEETGRSGRLLLLVDLDHRLAATVQRDADTCGRPAVREAGPRACVWQRSPCRDLEANPWRPPPGGEFWPAEDETRTAEQRPYPDDDPSFQPPPRLAFATPSPRRAHPSTESNEFLG